MGTDYAAPEFEPGATRYITLAGSPMIKCHLGRLMGERKVRIADLARAPGCTEAR